MPIHANHINTRMMALSASQGTQQAIAAKKAAATVRRKLGRFAATADIEGFPEVEADSDAAAEKEPQPQADSFKHFFSITA